MSPTGHSTHQQTRQQLDELDTLLQRMLSIPAGSDASAPPTTPEYGVAPDAFAPLPPTLPTARVFPQPPSVPPNASAPVVQAWRVEMPVAPASQPSPPLALPVDGPFPAPIDPRLFAPPPAPPSAGPAPYPYSMVFGPAVNQEAGASTTAPMQPAPALAPPLPGIPGPQWHAPRSAEPPPVPFLLLPVLVFNRIFDLVSFLLGPLGSWLRQPAGRNTLGWLGILMILAAIGWGVADWYGIEWIP